MSHAPVKTNPFPGLRPFTQLEDYYLFFVRSEIWETGRNQAGPRHRVGGQPPVLKDVRPAAMPNGPLLSRHPAGPGDGYGRRVGLARTI